MSTTDDHGPAPADGREARAPRPRLAAPVWLCTGALALVAAAVGWLALDAALRLGSGALSVGAQVFLVVIYAALAVWIGATAAGIARGRGWARGAATAILLFCVVLSMWMWTGGDVLLGVGLLAVAGVGLVAVMSRAVSEHLRRG